MSTVEVVKKDRIKAILDENCPERPTYGYCRAPDNGKARSSSVAGHLCWQCHRNDLLAERIAEEVGK